MNTELIWDRYARLYDKLMPLFSCYQNLLGKVAEHLKHCKTLLDVGCGTGNLIEKINEDGKIIYAVDNNLSMLSHVKEKFYENKNVFILYENAENLSFKNNFFDGASCINLLYYADKPNKILKEIKRVLKPGGLFVISGPKPNINYDLLQKEFLNNLVKLNKINELKNEIILFEEYNKELIAGFKNTYYPKELEKILLKEIGFSKVIHSSGSFYLNQNYFVTALK